MDEIPQGRKRNKTANSVVSLTKMFENGPQSNRQKQETKGKVTEDILTNKEQEEISEGLNSEEPLRRRSGSILEKVSLFNKVAESSKFPDVKKDDIPVVPYVKVMDDATNKVKWIVDNSRERGNSVHIDEDETDNKDEEEKNSEVQKGNLYTITTHIQEYSNTEEQCKLKQSETINQNENNLVTGTEEIVIDKIENLEDKDMETKVEVKLKSNDEGNCHQPVYNESSIEIQPTKDNLANTAYEELHEPKLNENLENKDEVSADHEGEVRVTSNFGIKRVITTECNNNFRFSNINETEEKLNVAEEIRMQQEGDAIVDNNEGRIVTYATNNALHDESGQRQYYKPNVITLGNDEGIILDASNMSMSENIYNSVHYTARSKNTNSIFFFQPPRKNADKQKLLSNSQDKKTNQRKLLFIIILAACFILLWILLTYLIIYLLVYSN